MKRHHRVRRGAVLAVVSAIALMIAPPDSQPVEAQWATVYCRTDYTIENRLRRVTGQVNVECGNECFLAWCHDPPWGNWGVKSTYGGKIDGYQFAGWKVKGSDPWYQWNSCTGRNLAAEFNDGLGRQRAAPDNTRTVYSWTTYRRAGYRNQDTCARVTPEVRTDSDVELDHYELDKYSPDNFVATLDYGDIDTRITCSDSWNCSGTSAWHRASSTNGTGVSSEIRFKVRTSFSY